MTTSENRPENRPEVEPEAPTQVQPEARQYPDRSGWIIVFGVAQVLMGMMAAAMALLLALLPKLLASLPADARRPEMPSLLTAAAFYVVLAVAIVWLGVGSIRVKRWARIVTLAVSVLGLFTGIIVAAVLALVMVVLVLGGLGSPGAFSGEGGTTAAFTMLVVFGMQSVLFIGTPAAFLIFYTRPSVKETFFARDSRASLTDAVPVPVLLATAYFAFGAVSSVPSAFGGRAILVGRMVTGLAAVAYCLVQAGVYGYLAYGFYRLKTAAWRTAVAFEALLAINAAIAAATYRFDFSSMGVRAPSAEVAPLAIAMVRASLGFGVLIVVAFIAFLFYLRRYFPRAAHSVASPEA